MKTTIHDIAHEFDRLCPSQVDETTNGNGQQEAGHIGHDTENGPLVGWYCSGGNCGHPVCEIPTESIQPMYDHLGALADGSLDGGGIREIVEKFGGEWLV